MKHANEWIKMPTWRWESIIEELPRPIGAEAARADLAYFASREWWDGVARPGRRTLGKRWGWSDARVRGLLAREWGDIQRATHHVYRTLEVMAAGQMYL